MKDQIILTAKDEEILNLRRSGATLKEIASKVFMSKRSVDYALNRLRKAVGAKNDIELISKLFSQKIA